MSQKPTYVADKTASAKAFDDARPRLGSGGNTLKTLRETTPDAIPIIDSIWHLASHMGGLATAMEKQAGLVRYSSVNPAGGWGRATIMAREAMAAKIDPKHIIITKQV
jgi:hypothetical protein